MLVPPVCMSVSQRKVAVVSSMRKWELVSGTFTTVGPGTENMAHSFIDILRMCGIGCTPFNTITPYFYI